MPLLNFFKKNKKIFSLAIVILIIAGVFVLTANKARAFDVYSWAWGKAGLSGLTNISFYLIVKFAMGATYVVWFIFGAILQLAAWFLDWVLSSASFTAFTKATIVTTGWTITRDLVNMFFALILIIVSFATILRIENYGVKQVLPRLIIAALLINFSLVIAGVIIDFSQVLTSYFVSAARGGGNLVAVEIANGLNIYDLKESSKLLTASDAAKGSLNALLLYIPNLFMGIIVMLVAAFVLFAAAILLIVRVVILWFLLILTPLAWIFSVLPATRGIWNNWWSTLLKWAFFAPAYAFFYYLSISVIRSGVFKQDAGIQAMSLGATNASKIFNLSFFMDYVIIIGLLLGGLIISQKMGIWGASAMMGIAKSGGKFVVRKGTGYERWAPVATRAAGVTLAAIGLKKTGGIVQGKALQMHEKQLERAENKAYQKYLSSLAPAQLKNEMQSAKGINALMVAQAIKERGLVKTAELATVQKTRETFESFRKTKDATEVEQIRPETITEPKKLTETIANVIQEGNLNLVSHLALENEDVVKAIAESASAQQIEALRNKSKQNEENLKTSLDKLSANIDNEDNKAVQFAYASQTGDVKRMNDVQKVEWAKTTGAEGLKRIQSFDIKVVENIPINKMRSALEGIQNGEVASKIADHVVKAQTAAGYEVDPYIRNIAKEIQKASKSSGVKPEEFIK